MGLCFISLRDSFSVGILCAGGGEPIKSRAFDFTAFVALNLGLFFLGAMVCATPFWSIGIMQ